VGTAASAGWLGAGGFHSAVPDSDFQFGRDDDGNGWNASVWDESWWAFIGRLMEIPAGWETKNLQLVLRVRAVGKAPAQPEMVAWHLWL